MTVRKAWLAGAMTAPPAPGRSAETSANAELVSVWLRLYKMFRVYWTFTGVLRTIDKYIYIDLSHGTIVYRVFHIGTLSLLLVKSNANIWKSVAMTNRRIFKPGVTLDRPAGFLLGIYNPCMACGYCRILGIAGFKLQMAVAVRTHFPAIGRIDCSINQELNLTRHSSLMILLISIALRRTPSSSACPGLQIAT